MKSTRFRAYQLGEIGSSFSYTVDNHITLIEARYNDVNKENVISEVLLTGKDKIDCLHITSWDEDHCNSDELSVILRSLQPSRIEYPGYKPDTDCGKESEKLIKKYFEQHKNTTLRCYTPDYLKGLSSGKELEYNDIIYNPITIVDNHNDNSVVKLFRHGRFTVLSLGDCEDSAIAQRIMACKIASIEVDVLLLAHHGADNGFTTKEFIDKIAPRVAICSSNYDNEFEHPRKEIRDILYEGEVPLFTTKTGDVIISCQSGTKATVSNFIGNNEVLSSKKTFETKLNVPD